MDNESSKPPKSEPQNQNKPDDTIDELLPVPKQTEESSTESVDGPIDEVLPIPGTESDTKDDEPFAWELEGDETKEEENHDPINQDSIVFQPTYQAKGQKRENRTGDNIRPDESTSESSPDRQCPACGAAIGNVPYCPQCGTEQFPNSRLTALLAPLVSWSRPLAIRVILAGGGLLILLALLSDSGATALVISAIALPIALLVGMALKLQDHTPSGWIHIGIMGFAGLAGGFPLAWLATRIVQRAWFDGGVLNYGAAGFGGNFAQTDDVAPFLVWLVVGLLLPIIAILIIGAAPGALRLGMSLRPRESTGMLLSGAVATGFVIASSSIFYRPLFSELAPQLSTSQWTLTIVNVAVTRPMVWIFSGAMIGALVWRYLRTPSFVNITIPTVIATGIPIGFSLVSLAAAPAGHWAETVAGLIFAVIATFFCHRFLQVAIRNDSAIPPDS